MISVACHIPNAHDATNWYRGTGPLSHLRKCYPNRPLHFEFLKEWSYASVQMHDAAFFQRPSTPSELEAIRICRRLRVPVVVDYDDLLFDLPEDNPAYQMYMNPKTKETIVSIVREADLVWVSTKELKRCLQITDDSSLNKRVFVVPNALDDIHLVAGQRGLPPPRERRQPAVIWRGSPTHMQDVMEYAPEISDVAQSSPKTSFVFVGYNPWFLTRGMGRQAICSGALSVGEFMDFLYSTAARIGIVPLHDSRFNRCKSNIAWLEMSWAGGVVLAPDWEEWRHPGIVAYRNGADFKAGLKALVEMEPEKLAELNKMSWNHIVKNFTLSKVNDIRMATLMAVMNHGDWPDGWQRIPEADDKIMELE